MVKKKVAKTVVMRFVGNTRFIVMGHKLPSGKTIDVLPGNRVRVSSADAAVLESIGRRAGCCGAPPTFKKYFVKES